MKWLRCDRPSLAQPKRRLLGAVDEAFKMVQDLRSALLGELHVGSGKRQWGAWLIVVGTALLLAGAVGALVVVL